MSEATVLGFPQARSGVQLMIGELAPSLPPGPVLLPPPPTLLGPWVQFPLPRDILFFFFLSLFIFEIETEHDWRRGRKRETQNLKQDPGSNHQHRAQCGARTHKL